MPFHSAKIVFFYGELRMPACLKAALAKAEELKLQA